jgi:hypothetical protein
MARAASALKTSVWGVNGFCNSSTGLLPNVWRGKGCSVYPDMNKSRMSGRTATMRSASSGPLMRGITTSLKSKSMGPECCSQINSASPGPLASSSL